MKRFKTRYHLILYLLMSSSAVADSVQVCTDDRLPGSYVDASSERIWCSQEGIWNLIPHLLAFFHPLPGWISLLAGLSLVGLGGVLTGRPAMISGWLSGGRLLNVTYHPAIAGSSSFLLRLVGVVITLAGFLISFIGVVFVLT